MVVLPIWSFTTVCLQHIRIDYNSLGGWHFLSTVLVLIDTCQLCISLVHGLVKCYTVIPLVPGEHGATLDSDWMVGVTYHIMFVCNVVGFFFEMLKFICTLPLSYIYIHHMIIICKHRWKNIMPRGPTAFLFFGSQDHLLGHWCHCEGWCLASQGFYHRKREKLQKVGNPSPLQQIFSNTYTVNVCRYIHIM